MKIAIIADPELPVPPLLYGGIERIIAMLVDGYVHLGHEVSLFAHKDSKTSAKLFKYKGLNSNNKKDILLNSLTVNRELFANKYDLVHSFGRLVYLLPQLPRKFPKLMSYQREPSVNQIKKAFRLARKNSLAFSGCSAYISNQILPHAPAYPVFNGVAIETYNFNPVVTNDAPLVFLGRIEPIKGTHVAIEVARSTGKKLIIAGNIPNEHEDYFNTKIKPHLNEQISYIGAVDDVQKNMLLGNASAFLMPIEWNEPFGIVMAEAMACGTPVVAFNRGSVPEVVIHGLNGYRCENIQEMIESVSKINLINRKNVRMDFEARFSADVIINQYLDLYAQLLSEASG